MKLFLAGFLVVCCFSNLNASTRIIAVNPKEATEDSLSKANSLYDQKAYLSALPLYQYLLSSNPDKKNQVLYKYRLGICCLYKTDQYAKALELLSQVAEENKKNIDIPFYLGRAFMLNYKFDEAIEQFNNYIAQKKTLPELKELAAQYIENCNNGKEFSAQPQNVRIENIGQPVNSSASEYVPVISSDESVLIFTYRGEKSTGGFQPFDINNPNSSYTEDVFISEKTDGKWSVPYSAGSNINSIDHDACIALSGDGQKLFVFKNNRKDLGDIYMSRLAGKNWSVPERLKGDVNTDSWEGSCSISANEKTLYFSSERPGGYGGKDLYKATLQHDGTWGNVQNLGSDINTPYDEDAPFIHPDGTTLIFSSKGHTSMGGYDIFKSFRMDTAWSPPENMGCPINTPGDDIYYVLSADGNRGYYSSDKAGGFGQQDIYIATPALPGWKPALVLLKGTIFMNDNPSDADIEVVLLNNNENVGNYQSNTSSGKYLINLPAGADYKVIYRKKGYEDQTKIINNTNIDNYSEINYDVKFYDKLSLSLVDASGKKLLAGEQKGWRSFCFTHLPSDSVLFFLLEGKDESTLKEISICVKDSTFIIPRCKDNYFCLRQNPDNNASLKRNLADIPFGKAENYNELVNAYGNIKAEGLEFKVQVGAYHSPENFKYKTLNPLGKVNRKKYNDEITRFTIGSFKTLKDADKLLKKVLAKEYKDAFVTAFYHGKRFLLSDLKTLKK